jgi:acyl-CoA thioester hydrolase
MLTQHTIELRVRYQETDGQGRAHHANYLKWFEQGRVELLRACGHSYKDLEAAGLFLVIAEAHVEYFLGAEFDDLLQLTTTTERCKGVRIQHRYELRRGDQLIAQGRTTVACVDKTGKVSRLPSWLVVKDVS